MAVDSEGRVWKYFSFRGGRREPIIIVGAGHMEEQRGSYGMQTEDL